MPRAARPGDRPAPPRRRAGRPQRSPRSALPLLSCRVHGRPGQPRRHDHGGADGRRPHHHELLAHLCAVEARLRPSVGARAFARCVFARIPRGLCAGEPRARSPCPRASLTARRSRGGGSSSARSAASVTRSTSGSLCGDARVGGAGGRGARALAAAGERWIAQRFVRQQAIPTPWGDRFVTLGAYVLDGRFAGYFARVTPQSHVSHDALCVPVFVGDEEALDETHHLPRLPRLAPARLARRARLPPRRSTPSVASTPGTDPALFGVARAAAASDHRRPLARRAHRPLAAPVDEPLAPLREAHAPVGPRRDAARRSHARRGAARRGAPRGSSPRPAWPRTASRPTTPAWFVDLAGAASIAFADALSHASRASIAAIPTFNNWPAENELVPAEQTLTAMIQMPPRLPADDDVSARPMFLLDSWRLAYKDETIDEGVIDNRYMLTARRLSQRRGPPRSGDHAGRLRGRQRRDAGRGGRSPRALRELRGRGHRDLHGRSAVARARPRRLGAHLVRAGAVSRYFHVRAPHHRRPRPALLPSCATRRLWRRAPHAGPLRPRSCWFSRGRVGAFILDPATSGVILHGRPLVLADTRGERSA